MIQISYYTLKLNSKELSKADNAKDGLSTSLLGKLVGHNQGLYSIGLSIIALWWMIAFAGSFSSSHGGERKSVVHAPLSPVPHIHPIDRQQLIRALQGEEELMRTLISEWEQDLQRLEAPYFPTAPPNHRPNSINDDSNRTFDLTRTRSRFLPQTYVAATILLSLADPHEIVALPTGLRCQTDLLDGAKMSQIALDTDRFSGEEIHREHPDLAFVAHYSLPATREALDRQDIELFDLNNIETPEQIIQAIRSVGAVTNHGKKAEQLAQLVEVAMARIDAELQYRRVLKAQPPSPFLCLTWYGRLAIPSSRSLTGQLLIRLHAAPSLLTPEREARAPWSVPTDVEEVVQFQPKGLLLLASDPSALKLVQNTPGLSNTPALCSGQLFFADDSIHGSPSQYIALAYFDLFEAIVRTEGI